jgi:hypothetical protein
MSLLHSTLDNLCGALDQMIDVLRLASSLGRLPDQVLLLSLAAKIQLLRDDVITELALEYENDKTALLKLADDLWKSGHQAPLGVIDYLLSGIASAGPEMLLPRAIAARMIVRYLQMAIAKINASASTLTATEVPTQHNTTSAPTSDNGPMLALMRVFTNNIDKNRIQKAAQLLIDDQLTVNEKLNKIDALIPLPATVSAGKLGAMLGVTRQAVWKTEWWIQNRKQSRPTTERPSQAGRELQSASPDDENV